MALMKTRRGALAATVAGNALYPLLSQGALTLSAGVITDATRLAGVQGDGATYPDSSVGVWPAATNLGTNGGLETNTTGWSTYGTGASVTRVTTTSKFGSACGKVTSAGAGAFRAGSGGTNSITGAPVSQVTRSFSLWVKGEGATIGKTVSWQVNESGGASGDNNMGGVAAASSTLTSSWQRLTVTGSVTQADRTSLYAFATVTADGAGEVFYVDGYQPELGLPTPYIETDGGTASRVLGRWQSPANPRLNGNQGWIAVRFKCGGLASYAPLVVLQNDTDSGADNRVAIDSSAGVGRYRMERKDGAGATAQAALSVGDAVVLGDDVLFVARWSATAVGVAKGGGGAWINAAATNVFSYNSHHLDTRLRWSTTAGSYTTQYWVAAGDGVMPDDGRDLMHSWGNNDPLPHQFPRSWGLCELEHFNGDGTMYRYAA